ncbi:unnamed protein product [Adineta steineri]|uniref:G-protein coupled receptors family 1 profile domain-containing protein n=1 Tax=Adineta steineri TaxID=433720 RepID=A0A815MJN5_9BILA|nr:unnamed protein product [Adineta steineri]CAF1619567.1 unnamed protein product [Adineta steineri]
MVTFETWFICFDIFMIIGLILTIILSSIFLLVIISDKTCHTLPMMLIANTCFSQFIFTSDILFMIIVTLKNDLKQIDYQDSLCIVRGYLSYALCIIMNCSFLLQALHRYILVVYPTRLFWQTKKIYILFICITWIYGFLSPLAFIFTGDITYDVDNQICQIPLKLSFSLIFAISNVYIIPTFLIQLIYMKLVRYVKEIRKRVTTGNSLFRAQRELRMVRRILIVLTILIIFGLPYTIFILISFFTEPPKYHFRIAGIFINSSSVFVMIALFQFTEPLKVSMLKRINLRPTVIRTIT